MSKLRDPTTVAKAIGCNLCDVQKILDPLISELDKHKCLTANTLIGALATTATECHCKPVEEAFYLSKPARDRYFNKTKYGKIDPQTGKRYYGRGFIQLTWRAGYEFYGKQLNIDLLNHPEKALEPDIAVKILVLYFVNKGIPRLCNNDDWLHVRKAVNGGLNGYTKFIGCVNRLLPLAKEG